MTLPILATFEQGANPFPMPDPDVRRLDFASIDGTSVLRWADEAFIIQSGIRGLQIPPRRIVTDDVPGLDGARLRDVYTGPREVVLPFFIWSKDQEVVTHLEQLAEVRAYFNYRTVDTPGNDGNFDLVATQQDGESSRRLRCVYVDGMEGVNGILHGNAGSYSTFDTKLLAVDPYWHGDEWSTVQVRLPGNSPFLSNNPADGFPRAITASVALGEDMLVEVPGDVPSAAVVELFGPMDSTLISSPSGLNVAIGQLQPGDHFILDTGRTKRALLNGIPAWEKVGQSPQWRPLAPGETTISVEVTGASDQTRARVYGTSLWETAW